MKLLPEPDQKPVLLTPKENPFIEAMLSQNITSKRVLIGNCNHDQLYQLSQKAMQAQQSMSAPGSLTMLQAGSLCLLRTQT